MARRAGFVLVAGAGVLLGASPARAVDNGPTQTGDICMQKVFGTPVSGSNKLNCTANDIQLSRAISVSPSSCTEGETFPLTATFETIVTANARYDAGFFFRIDGGGSARGDGTNATGMCSLSALTPDVFPATESDGDTCGDLNAGTYNLTFTIPNVKCDDSDGDGLLNLPNCTSWHSNQATTCDISDPPVLADAFDFDPDTKSKCVCDDTFQVPVTVARPTLTMTPTAILRYDVKATNTSATKSMTLQALCDDKFGTIDANTGYSCDPVGPIPSLPPGVTVSRGTCDVPQTLATANAGNTDEYSCSYFVEVPVPGLGDLNSLTNTLKGIMVPQGGVAISPAPSDQSSVRVELTAL